MFSAKSIQFVLLVSLLAWQCSAPKESTKVPEKPADPNDRISRLNMTDLNGKPVKLSDFAGKPVFLNFWATWCGPCVSEMQSIEKASQQFKDKINFLAVSNEPVTTIQSYLKKNKFSFQFGHLEGSYVNVFVLALPTTLLIDKNGQIVSEEEGYRNWTSPSSIKMLEELVAK
ncbi:MAG TPA: TlpA disulfide reductase family protein [Saprospiraceae bacterium]|nr:TlpA disulfide reductase family protein [Saprospiraceae bacterium]